MKFLSDLSPHGLPPSWCDIIINLLSLYHNPPDLSCTFCETLPFFDTFSFLVLLFSIYVFFFLNSPGLAVKFLKSFYASLIFLHSILQFGIFFACSSKFKANFLFPIELRTEKYSPAFSPCPAVTRLWITGNCFFLSPPPLLLLFLCFSIKK